MEELSELLANASSGHQTRFLSSLAVVGLVPSAENANSVIWVLPMTTAPAARKRVPGRIPPIAREYRRTSTYRLREIGSLAGTDDICPPKVEVTRSNRVGRATSYRTGHSKSCRFALDAAVSVRSVTAFDPVMRTSFGVHVRRSRKRAEVVAAIAVAVRPHSSAGQ
jgi:hypothetical protein